MISSLSSNQLSPTSSSSSSSSSSSFSCTAKPSKKRRSEVETGRKTMAQLCSTHDSGHLLLLTLLYDYLLSLIFFLYSHPLHLAYLLYFSPYILHLLSFLFPLLLSTSIPLLLFSLHCILKDEAAACLIEQLGSIVVAKIGNVFEWEFEAMSELYQNGGLICEVEEEDPAEICVEKSAQAELLQSNFGSGERVTLKGSSFEQEDPRGTIVEFDKRSGLNCEVSGDHVELLLKNSGKTKLSEPHFGIDNDRISLKSSSFEPETPSNHRKSMREVCEISSLNCEVNKDPAELSSEQRSEIAGSHSEIGDQVNSSRGCSFVPQTPDRISEILVNSPVAKSARQRAGASESLSKSGSMRSGSMRTGSMRIPGEFYKHSSLNYEVTEGPDEIFFDSSEKEELLKPESEEGGSFKSRNLSGMQENLNDSPSIRSKDQEGRAMEGLQREGSMRKEKEWKRTLSCKLYEEHMTFKLREEGTVVDGAEEMDLLWEAYEADAGKSNKVKSKGKNGGKKEVCIEEEEEEDEPVGKFCCLQALRISTGKMNLGVGRRNLARVSKVFKGTGFFHRSSSSRSRKG